MTEEFDRLSVPKGGEVIEYDGGFHSPDAPILPVAHGVDGETVAVARDVLDSAVDLMGREINWFRIYLGAEARERCGETIPSDSIRALDRFRVGLVGALESDPRTIRETRRRLYSEMDFTVSMEQRSRTSRVPSPIRDEPDIDLTVFRDVTESADSRTEYDPEPEATTALRECLLESGIDAEFVPADPVDFEARLLSEDATVSMVETAIEYALDRDRRSLTLVQQGDLLPRTEGAFLERARRFLTEEYSDVTVDESTFEEAYGGTYPDDEIVVRERRTDEICRDLLQSPGAYDVVVGPSLSGGYVSRIAAEVVGGRGMVPQATVGEGRLIAGPQPTRSLASDGDVANPTGVILSGCLPFEAIGWDDTAAVVREPVRGCCRRTTHRRRPPAGCRRCSNAGEYCVTE